MRDWQNDYLTRLQRDMERLKPFGDLARLNDLIGSRESEVMRAAMGLGSANSAVERALGGLGPDKDIVERAKQMTTLSSLEMATRGIGGDLASRIASGQLGIDQAYAGGIAASIGSGLPASVIAAHDAARVLDLDHFTRPEHDILARMAKDVAGAIGAHAHWKSAVLGWDQELLSRMDRLTGDWAIRDALDISGLAFGELSYLRDVVHFDQPYAPQTRDYVEEELGEVVEAGDVTEGSEGLEARYDEAGRDPALVAFPAPQFPNIIVAAGFGLQIPAPPVPQPVANGMGPVGFADEHHAMLRSTEVHMRGFIERELYALEGQLWIKRRVPGDISKRWTERRDEAQDLKQPVFDLIHYSDFNDLGQIIGQRNNWNDAFKAYFGDKEGMQVSFRRLSPLRNGDAHNRPFCQTEILYLAAESVRLLRAIGIL